MTGEPDPNRPSSSISRNESDTQSHGCLCTINGGSSSLKFAVFTLAEPPVKLLSGCVERIGRGASRLLVSDLVGPRSESVAVEAPDQDAAAGLVIDRFRHIWKLPRVVAVGHRVVHGGPKFVETEVVSDTMLVELQWMRPFDPDHLPGEITLIHAFQKAFPEIPQVACFDTAFHRSLPTLARIVPIPRKYQALGVRRYGFHGLSYAYLMEELERVAGAAEARGRAVLAHLGSGASLAAVHGGLCQDTTMGFTPTSGLVMGTRSGDLDPSLGWFLSVAEGMSPEGFHHMATKESGLLGVSETSADMRDLMERRSSDSRAAEAIDLFCYQAKKGIGAFAAAMGGLDSLIFSGGIGENVPEVRALICDGLEFLGIELDPVRNQAGAPLISINSATTAVRVLRTNEEAMIAREVVRMTRGTI